MLKDWSADHGIKDFNKCDFQAIRDHLNQQKVEY
jgi:hypothetical protein